MPFIETPPLKYWVSTLLSEAGIPHGVFTRRGGVSPPPWDSLNLGSTVGDDRDRVRENLRRMFAALGRPLESRYDVWLVHSARVVCASGPRPDERPHIQADAILTDRPDLTLVMRYADCVPILLADPVRRVVGIVHAGWRGTVLGVTRRAVEQMSACYGSRPADILAAIGPSIGPDHYEVGPEVRARFVSEDSGHARFFVPSRRRGHFMFDLPGFVRMRLEHAGVARVEDLGLCTYADAGRFFSYRRATHRGEPDYGRQLSAIMLTT